MPDIKFKIHRQTIYHCTLERAFKTPMLCDVSKVHTGYGPMPKITHTTDDSTWGQPGSSKKVFTAKSWIQKGGFASVDHVVERIENTYWKIQVDDFQTWMLGFYKFVGEWQTTQLEPNKVQIDYTYTLHTRNVFCYPFAWLFAKLFWKKYMNQVLENIRKMTEQEEPYMFA